MNRIVHGDNLGVLQQMEAESVELIEKLEREICQLAAIA